jgi:quinoprotein glucose dehydrogenase
LPTCALKSEPPSSDIRRTLADINFNGRTIKAVAQPTKQGCLYVLDRVNGQPVWPIEERPVPQSDVPGEKDLPDAALPA